MADLNTNSAPDREYMRRQLGSKRWWDGLRAVQAGTGKATIMWVGDSVGTGSGAGTGGSNTNARVSNIFSQIKGLFVAAGFPCQDDSFYGTSGYATLADITDYDPRLTFSGVGWAIDSTGVISSRNFRNNNVDTTSLINFQTVGSVDTVEIATLRNGAGSIDILIDDVLNTTITPSASLAVNRTVISGLSLAPHKISFRRASGDVRVLGAKAYSASRACIEFVNISASGAQMTSYGSTTNPYSPGFAITGQNADLALCNLGINDAKAAVTNDVYSVACRQVATAQLAAGGDMLFLGPNRFDTALVAGNIQENFEATMKGIAAGGNCDFLSMSAVLGLFATANSNGDMADQTHPNSQGAGKLAAAIYNRIKLPA